MVAAINGKHAALVFNVITLTKGKNTCAMAQTVEMLL
jgi:hypothetical protein